MPITPGPWVWTRMDGDKRDPLWVLGTPKRDVVLTIKDLEFGPTTDPQANRAALAAVPDLLEAGDDLVDALMTAAPSTMYPKIVSDAMNAWIAARQKAEPST